MYIQYIHTPRPYTTYSVTMIIYLYTYIYIHIGTCAHITEVEQTP